MRIFSDEEARQGFAETAAQQGIHPTLLMQRAGAAVGQFCLAQFKFESACLICGKGRTGGIGLAAAAYLKELGMSVSVLLVAETSSDLQPDSAEMLSRLRLQPTWISAPSQLGDGALGEALQTDLIVDALTGPDAVGALEQKVIEGVNDAFGTVVSVDLPSGVEADRKVPIHQQHASTVFAHAVITFIAPRPAHVFGQITSGSIAVSELGAQPTLTTNRPKLQVVTGQEVALSFPRRWDGTHEGPIGRVLVIGGPTKQIGKASLAGLAALRSGANSVTVACPNSARCAVSGVTPDLIVEELGEEPENPVVMNQRMNRLIANAEAIVLAQDFSDDGPESELFESVIGHNTLALILNLDRLGASDKILQTLKNRPLNAPPFLVLLIQPRDAAAFLGMTLEELQKDRAEAARCLSEKTRACVVLRGSPAIIAGTSGETWINLTGNPVLDRHGSGDVLCGIIAAALARQSEVTRSAEPGVAHADTLNAASELSKPDPNAELRDRLTEQLRQDSRQAASFLKDARVAAAVYLHGLAANIARDRLHENSVLATDIINNLAQAFRKCDQQADDALYYVQP